MHNIFFFDVSRCTFFWKTKQICFHGLRILSLNTFWISMVSNTVWSAQTRFVFCTSTTIFIVIQALFSFTLHSFSPFFVRNLSILSPTAYRWMNANFLPNSLWLNHKRAHQLRNTGQECMRKQVGLVRIPSVEDGSGIRETVPHTYLISASTLNAQAVYGVFCALGWSQASQTWKGCELSGFFPLTCIYTTNFTGWESKPLKTVAHWAFWIFYFF